MKKIKTNSIIKIHTISLGSGASNATLKLYAEQTGGEFFAVTTAENLEEIYDSLSIGNQFDFDTMTDTDGDGIPDEIEVSGLPCSNGMIFFTDPGKADTDGDGLNDSQEVIPVIERRRYYPAGTPDEAVSYKYYFEFRSDPTKVDSDGDGILDPYDEFPTNSEHDPLSPTNIESVQFINIPSSNSNQPDFVISIVKSKIISDEIFFAYAEGITNTGGFLVTDEVKKNLNDLENSYQKHLLVTWANNDEAAAHAAKLETDQLVQQQYFEYGSIAYYGCWAYNYQSEMDLFTYYSNIVNKAIQAYTVYISIISIYQTRMLALEQESITLSKSEYVETVQTVTKGSGNLNKYGIDIENLNFSDTVIGHINRPYQESKLLINEIMESKVPILDPQGTNALYWEVNGSFNGSTGYYELLIDPVSNTVWHFVYKSYGGV